MSKKIIPEKTLEILFNRYLSQHVGLRNISLYAPSSVEEYKNGYDTKIYGLSSFKEIYLQFKSPKYSEKKKTFHFDTTPHQHKMLKKYPANTAFYIVPTFESLDEFVSVQKNLKACNDFLKYFLAVEVSRLPKTVNRIKYTKPENHSSSPELKFSLSGNGKSDFEPVNPSPGGWRRCSQLIKGKEFDEIGMTVELYENVSDLDLERDWLLPEKFQHPFLENDKLWKMSSIKADKIAEDVPGKDLGVCVRLFP